MKNRDRLPAILAGITLLIAYFVPMFFMKTPDYLPQYQAMFPEADDFVRCSTEPPIYKVWATRNGEPTALGYIGIGSAVGYEGPIVTAVACDLDGNIMEIVILEHIEWMTWYNKVEKAGLMDAFAGRRVTDALTLDIDVDGVTSATFTARGITDGVREASHAIARGQLQLPVTSTGRDLRLSTEALAVLAIWAVVIIGVLTKQNKLRWLTMLASLIVIGFWLAAPVSFSSLVGMLMGRIPPLETAHLVWYILIIGILATVIVFGRNLYCYWICPFGALHELLALAGGGTLAPSRSFSRVLRAARPLLVWAALLIAFLTRSAAASSYEPFGTIFTFTGSNIRWTFLIFILVLGILSHRFWCLHFCPVGYIIDLTATGRRRIRKFLNYRARPANAPHEVAEDAAAPPAPVAER